MKKKKRSSTKHKKKNTLTHKTKAIILFPEVPGSPCFKHEASFSVFRFLFVCVMRMSVSCVFVGVDGWWLVEFK
jgi:hypothetical protein